jgi:hypothetical protein
LAVVSLMSRWTPDLLRRRTCACSPLKLLDYSIEWDLIGYKC